MKAPKNCLGIIRPSASNPSCWIARTVQRTALGRERTAQAAPAGKVEALRTCLSTLTLTESAVRLAQAFDEVAAAHPQLPQAA